MSYKTRHVAVHAAGVPVLFASLITGCGSGPFAPVRPITSSVPASIGLLYQPVARADGTGAIVSVSTQASGATTPTTVVEDPNGNLALVCVDGLGDLSALESSSLNGNQVSAIVEYAITASGTAAPIRKLEGPATQRYYLVLR